MIGRIRGELLEKTPPQILLEAAGVGYELEVPMPTFYDLPACGASVTLHVHMLVREDAQLLYGFASLAERSLFRALLKVNGVGARVALAILSGISAQEFASCINNNDITALTRIPGIGKKTAERLVVEMKDKLPSSSQSSSAQLSTSMSQTSIEAPRTEAINALVSLGYKAADATKLVNHTRLQDASVEEYIRAALQSVGPG